MRVRWTPAARDDFRREIQYIAHDSPGAARAVARRIRDAARRLATYPEMGRPGQVLDTRELVVPHTPYTLAYIISGQVVEIVGCTHQARMWPESFDLGQGE